MAEESPWTTFDNAINLVLMIVLLVYATFMLVIKASWLFLALFWVMILLYMTVGRYTTCRHCDFLGKACPSWCMGIIGAKLYKRSEKENFCKDGFLIPFLTDVLFLFIGFACPIIAYFIAGLLLFDWMILIIYIVLLVATLGVHWLAGCRKCPIKDCPMAGK